MLVRVAVRERRGNTAYVWVIMQIWDPHRREFLSEMHSKVTVIS